MSIIMVFGSRYFRRYEIFSSHMTNICKAIGKPKCVITGRMIGIDDYAQQWAYNNKIDYKVSTKPEKLLNRSVILITFSNKKSIWLRNLEKKARNIGVRHFDIHI